jgi:hypothetical protein
MSLRDVRDETRHSASMTTCYHSFDIDGDASDQRLALAGELLKGGEAIVSLKGVVHLRSEADCLLCEVVDPTPSLRRCAEEFAVMVENARRALEASRLSRYLPDWPQRWIVTKDYGMGTLELWPHPDTSGERSRD